MAFEIFDDSAFCWFLQTLLSITLLPFTIYKSINFLRRRKSKVDYSRCQCSLCKANKNKKTNSALQSFIKGLIFTSLWLFYIWIFYTIKSDFAEKNKEFNPYEILKLDQKASTSEIKRRYYNLSLQLHPDKQQGKKSDTERDKKYLLVKKAYQALSDPEARENYEIHGHPDGKQGISITIGLPSFLTAKENAAGVLIGYVALIVLLAVGAIKWRRKAISAESKVLQKETVGGLLSNISRESNPRHLLELFCLAKEFRDLDKTQSDEFAKLFDFCKKQIKLGKSNYMPYINYTWTLLVSHICSIKLPPVFVEDQRIVLQSQERMLPELLKILSDSSMWTYSKLLSAQKKQKEDLTQKQKFKILSSPSRVPLVPVSSLLKLSQLIAQKLKIDSEDLMQIPHMSLSGSAALRKYKIGNLKQFISAFGASSNGNNENEQPESPKYPKVENWVKSLTRLQSFDIDRFIEAIPLIKDQSDLIEGKTEYGTNDKAFALLKFRKTYQRGIFSDLFKHLEPALTEEKKATTINNSNKRGNKRINSSEIRKRVLSERKKRSEKREENFEVCEIKPKKFEKSPKNSAENVSEIRPEKWSASPRLRIDPVAHCPRFPFDKREDWYVLAYDEKEKNVVFFEKVAFDAEGLFEKHFPLFTEKAGFYSFQVRLVSANYVALEIMSTIEYRVVNRESEIEENESEEDEHVSELYEEEKEKSMLQMEWYDVVFLAVFCVLLYFVLPETDIGRTYLSPLKERVVLYVKKLLGRI